MNRGSVLTDMDTQERIIC